MIRRLLGNVFAVLRTRRGAVCALVALAAAGGGAAQVRAWSHFRSAEKALARHDPGAARVELSACARLWGDRAAVRLMACRAAWQDGDIDAAATELRAAQTALHGATEATAFEWALVQAAAGNVREVEEYLQTRSEQSPEIGPAASTRWRFSTCG